MGCLNKQWTDGQTDGHTTVKQYYVFIKKKQHIIGYTYIKQLDKWLNFIDISITQYFHFDVNIRCVKSGILVQNRCFKVWCEFNDLQYWQVYFHSMVIAMYALYTTYYCICHTVCIARILSVGVNYTFYNQCVAVCLDRKVVLKVKNSPPPLLPPPSLRRM